MTTPDGRPSVTSLGAQINRNIMGSNVGDEAQVQAAAMGSTVINDDGDEAVYMSDGDENPGTGTQGAI
jgi:hypothetical protein